MTTVRGRRFIQPGASLLPGQFRRTLFALAYALRPNRWRVLPSVISAVALHLMGLEEQAREIRDPAQTSLPPGGLVGVYDDLGPDRLMWAYRHGVYPWCHIGPMKWWSPERRMVLFVNETHITKNLRQMLRKRPFRVTFDTAFEQVMRACAEPREGRPELTWITPRMVEAYNALHRAGHAHSVEVWNDRGELVGGLYGVSVGRVMFTESQFARARDASKYASAYLMAHLSNWGYVVRDAKNPNSHLESLGFRLIPREEFRALLDRYGDSGGREGRWTIDPEIDVAAWRPVPV